MNPPTITQQGELYLDLLQKCLTGDIFDESGWTYIEKVEMNGKAIPFPSDLAVVKKTPIDRAARQVGKDLPLFAYTMVGHARLQNIRNCVEQVLRDGVPGDLLEAGVWQGGCSIFMRALLKVHAVTDRVVWVADSFEGMPKPAPIDVKLNTQNPDLSDADYLAVPLETVRENFRKFNLLDEQVRFVKGWFKDTLAGLAIERISLLRLDGDLYESTRDTLRALYSKVSPGGFVIIDDYYSWEGCRHAVTEFRDQHRISAPLQQIDWTGAYWRVP